MASLDIQACAILTKISESHVKYSKNHAPNSFQGRKYSLLEPSLPKSLKQAIPQFNISNLNQSHKALPVKGAVEYNRTSISFPLPEVSASQPQPELLNPLLGNTYIIIYKMTYIF
jgi:hypothetical protein